MGTKVGNVSVVIPTRDRHDLLQRAIASIAAQHVLPDEIIVVGDGCTPLVEHDFGLNVKTIATSPGTGGSEARNVGIRASSGDWIALLDDDDEWLPTKLERQLAFAEQTGSNIVACRVIAATPSARLEWPRRLPRNGESLSQYLLVRTTPTVGDTLIQSSMLLIQRELLIRTPFKKGLRRHQEWDWLIRAQHENELKLGFVESAEAVWHSDDAVMQITKNADWRVSLDWIKSIDDLTGPVPARNFILTFMSRVAASTRDWKSLPVLAKASFRYGRPSIREALLFLLAWVMPSANTHFGSALRRTNGIFRTVGRRGKDSHLPSASKRRRAVLIVQPYVAEYRVAFYEKLRKSLDELGIDLWLHVGKPVGKQVKRSDAAQLGWVETVDTKLIWLFRKPIRWKSISRGKRPDLIVLPHGSGWADNYVYMLRREPIVLWGQGKPYTTEVHPLDRVLERLQGLRARHYLAYTQSGADALVDEGWKQETVTVLNNTIDTSGLEAAVRSVELSEVTANGGSTPNACLFIGGLDETKRLRFLLDACDIIANRIDDFELVVAGEGEKADWLRKQSLSRPWLKIVGKVGSVEKARLASRSKLVLMPGRVGLVAVDSFVLRCPIVTTNWKMHAPEYDYLTPQNSVTTEDNLQSYATTVSELLTNNAEIHRLKDGCENSSSQYSVDAMVSNYVIGLKQAMARTRPWNQSGSTSDLTAPTRGAEGFAR